MVPALTEKFLALFSRSYHYLLTKIDLPNTKITNINKRINNVYCKRYIDIVSPKAIKYLANYINAHLHSLH